MNAWFLMAGGIWIFLSAVFIFSLALAARDPAKKGSRVFLFHREESSSPNGFEVAPVMLRGNDK